MHFSPIMMQAAFSWHDRGVGDAKAREAVHAQLVVDHRHWVGRRAHHAGVEPRARNSRAGHMGYGNLVEQFAVAPLRVGA